MPLKHVKRILLKKVMKFLPPVVNMMTKDVMNTAMIWISTVIFKINMNNMLVTLVHTLIEQSI